MMETGLIAKQPYLRPPHTAQLRSIIAQVERPPSDINWSLTDKVLDLRCFAIQMRRSNVICRDSALPEALTMVSCARKPTCRSVVELRIVSVAAGFLVAGKVGAFPGRKCARPRWDFVRRKLAGTSVPHSLNCCPVPPRAKESGFYTQNNERGFSRHSRCCLAVVETTAIRWH
jgi:hypothetical protein